MYALKSDLTGSSYFCLSFSSFKEMWSKVQVVATRFLRSTQEFYLNSKNLKLPIGTMCAGMLIIPIYPIFGLLILLISSVSLSILLRALKTRLLREARLPEIEEMLKNITAFAEKINLASTIEGFETEFNLAKEYLNKIVNNLQLIKDQSGLQSWAQDLYAKFKRHCEALSEEYERTLRDKEFQKKDPDSYQIAKASLERIMIVEKKSLIETLTTGYNNLDKFRRH